MIYFGIKTTNISLAVLCQVWQTVNFEPWSQTKSSLFFVCVQTLSGTRCSPQSHFHALRVSSASRNPIREDGGSLQKEQRKKGGMKKHSSLVSPWSHRSAELQRGDDLLLVPFWMAKAEEGLRSKSYSCLSIHLPRAVKGGGWNERGREKEDQCMKGGKILVDLVDLSDSTPLRSPCIHAETRAHTLTHTIAKFDRSEGVRRDESVELSMLLMHINIKKTTRQANTVLTNR